MRDVRADDTIDGRAEDNLRTVRALFDGVAARDLTAILACYAPDVRIEEAPSLPYGGVYHGPAGAYEHALAFWRTWGAYQPSVDADLDPVLMAEGQQVIVQWQHVAYDPFTDVTVSYPAVGVYELTDGLITGSRMFHQDTAALMHFLDRVR